MNHAADPCFDVIVVGSGAAGLTAALTAADNGLSVVVLEADNLMGGATALSEGMIWVPNNDEARNLPDAPDPDEEAEAAAAYLRANAGNHVDQARLRSYIAGAPAALSFVAQAAGLHFKLNRYSRDYYPDAPGATVGRRALNPLPVTMRSMDRALFARIRPPLGTMMLFGGLSIASQDAPDYLSILLSPKAALRVARHVAYYALDRIGGWPRGTRLANGNGIVARLAQAIVARQGQIRTGWAVSSLTLHNGKVIGVAGPQGRLLARVGVILATGGLNASRAARTDLLGAAPHVAIPAAVNVMTLAHLVGPAGAEIVTSVSQPVLWAPASVVPPSLARSGPWPHFGDRAKPGVICVAPDGKRFANEAQVYHDFVPAMMAATADAANGPHCWIIADHRSLRRYGLGPIGPVPVRLGPYIRCGYLKCGRTPEDLARAIDVPADVLAQTVARFNALAQAGKDTDFGRGDSPYDRSNGDPGDGPNPTLGPLQSGPFYAIRMVPGDIGGFVGVATDDRARVLTSAGVPVGGLWAAGSAATPLTGGTYPAAGLTIGQAMTFGYLAALDAVDRTTQRQAAEWYLSRGSVTICSRGAALSSAVRPGE
ncbi:FAD-dependent oxidoreductase [Yoonia vestfoldensis]|uniref:FAD-dependent oxidoreductase n=1 Tax=Yoonia vestfoldensis TaxID=245188 RepID=UPI0013A562C5|nr:FAD-dependent oxidoreductase [Yoonia vestfoldensis]